MATVKLPYRVTYPHPRLGDVHSPVRTYLEAVRTRSHLISKGIHPLSIRIERKVNGIWRAT